MKDHHLPIAWIIVFLVAATLGLFLVVNPKVSKRTCSTFFTQKDAQAWSDAHKRILDRDKDGTACEALK